MFLNVHPCLIPLAWCVLNLYLYLYLCLCSCVYLYTHCSMDPSMCVFSCLILTTYTSLTSHDLRCFSSDDASSSTTTLDLRLCLLSTIVRAYTSHWSFRDLHKRLVNLRYAALASTSTSTTTASSNTSSSVASCARITTRLWLQELAYDDV